MVKEKDRKSYNRAIILIVIGIFLALWVYTNTLEWEKGAVTYTLYGVVGIALYIYWNKIRLFGK